MRSRGSTTLSALLLGAGLAALVAGTIPTEVPVDDDAQKLLSSPDTGSGSGSGSSALPAIGPIGCGSTLSRAIGPGEEYQEAAWLFTAVPNMANLSLVVDTCGTAAESSIPPGSTTIIAIDGIDGDVLSGGGDHVGGDDSCGPNANVRVAVTPDPAGGVIILTVRFMDDDVRGTITFGVTCQTRPPSSSPSPPTTRAPSLAGVTFAPSRGRVPVRPKPLPDNCGYEEQGCPTLWFCCAMQSLLEQDIPWGNFSFLPNTTGIDLGANLLTHLPKIAFSGPFSPGLTMLILSGNPLTALPDEWGMTLPTLIQLDVSGCQISTIVPGTFVGMTALSWLFLRNNILTTTHAAMFKGLVDIEQLDLSYNLLTAIDHDSFRGFHALRELFLSHNRLTSILPGTVDTLVHLQIFSLANNQLTAIPSVLLWDCTALTAFDVRFNRIARMPVWLALPNLLPNKTDPEYTAVMDTPRLALQFDGNQLLGCTITSDYENAIVQCYNDCVTGAGRAPTPMPVWNSSSASPENPTAGFWQGGDFWECHRFGVLASPAPACRDAIARIGSALRNHSGDGNGTFYVNDTVRIQGIVQDDAQGCKRKHLFENCGLDDPELVTFSLRFDDPNSTTCCRSIVIGSGNSASSGPTFGNFTRVPYAMQHGRPMWQNDFGLYLYYFPSDQQAQGGDWLFGSKYDTRVSAMTSTSANNAACPTMASGWLLYVNGNWTDGQISVTCAVSTSDDVETPGPFVMTDSETGAISILPDSSAVGHSFPHARLIATDATGSSTTLVGWTMRVEAKVLRVSTRWSLAEITQQPPATFELNHIYQIAGIDRSKWTDEVLFDNSQVGAVEFAVVVLNASAADANTVTDCHDGTAFARLSTLGTWTIELRAIDGSGALAYLATWTINVVPESTTDASAGSTIESNTVIIACGMCGVLCVGLVLAFWRRSKQRRARTLTATDTDTDTSAGRYSAFVPHGSGNRNHSIGFGQPMLASDSYEDEDDLSGLHSL